MKVFLTGATGYVGSAVARALRGAGHEVVGLARSEGAARRLSEAGFEAVLGDMTDAPLLARCAADADAVVHAALARGPEIPAADTAATRALLDAVRGTTKRLIYTSGVWVYGETGDTAADERSPTRPVPLAAWRPAVERLVLEAVAPRRGPAR